MPAAARLADPIAHSHALGGLIVGALIGAAIAVAVVGTGGLAAVAIVGGAAVGGAALGEMVGSLSTSMHVEGAIAAPCSPTVKINGKPAARAHVDTVDCDEHSPPPPPIAQGSGTVNINGMPAARKGDRTACDAVIYDGSPTVFIGGPQVTTDEISSEVPGWVHGAMFAVGLASAVVLAGPVVAVVGLLGGIVGGKAGSAIGGKLFGEGSDGQKIMAFGGGVLGGLVAGKGGAWFERNYEIKSVGLGSNLGNMRVVPKVNGRAPINAEYAGGRYPASKLPANLQAKYPNGVEFTPEGFPKYPSQAEVQLPPEKYVGTRGDHFKASNELLANQERQSPGTLKDQGLNQAQIDHVMKQPPSAESPPGLTWHHNEVPGKMQLVPSDIHDAVRHTGGYAIWGK